MTSTVKLLRIKSAGLKAGDIDQHLGDVTLFAGENGKGKTTILDAIWLLARGRGSSADLGKSNDATMRLARADSIAVKGWVRLPSGRAGTIKRVWKRTRSEDGKITVREEIDLAGFPPHEGSISAKRALIQSLLGSCIDAWEPADLLQLSADRLRKKLLDLIPRTERELAKWVPSGCPKFAQPDTPREDVLDWARAAIVRTRSEKKKLDDARDVATTILEEVVGEGTWKGEQSIEAKQLRAAQLREERVRAERAEKDARDLAKRTEQLRRLDDELERLGAELDEEEPQERIDLLARFEAEGALEELQQRLDELVRAERECRGFMEQAATLRVQAGPHADRTDRKALELDLASATEAVDSLMEELEDLGEHRRLLGAKIDVLERDVASILARCPSCNFEFRPHWDELKARHHELAKEAGVRAVELEGALATATTRMEQLEATFALLETGRLERDAGTRTASLVAQLQESYGEDFRLLPDRIPMAARARFEWERHRDRVNELTLRRSKLEMDLEIAQAELEETLAGLRPILKIEAEATELELELEQVGRFNQRAKMQEDAEEELARLTAKIGELLEWQKKFVAIETQLLDSSRAWLEHALSAGMGAEVCVELRDVRGKDTCRLSINGVDALTVSTGERFELLASLVEAIASAQPEAPWRPSVLDGFEAVSAGNRARFLMRRVSAVEAGAISQAFICGCPDSVPAVEGVQVVWLDGDSGGDGAAATKPADEEEVTAA